MEWYVEFDFVKTLDGRRVPMQMKCFYSESEAVQFAELETSDGEIGYVEEV